MTNKEAIKFLSQIMDILLANNSWLPSTDNPIKESFSMAINALTAQPEKEGKWSKEMIGATPYKYRCSKCNKYSRAMYDFCPNCGADMRGRENENKTSS